MILTLLIALVIAAAVWHLVIRIAMLLVLDTVDPANQALFHTIFGMIMTVLIALEFKHSLLGMLALIRKFIIIDVTRTEPAAIIGLALAVLALGGVYWLVREQDHREEMTGS